MAGLRCVTSVSIPIIIVPPYFGGNLRIAAFVPALIPTTDGVRNIKISEKITDFLKSLFKVIIQPYIIKDIKNYALWAN